jgi:2-phospho-L-lactate guanylyltransferase
MLRYAQHDSSVRFGLIPVKELPRAKARLAPVLDDVGRRELALALFHDVLAAALACPALDGVAVVTRDDDVLSVTAEAGAEGLPEPGGLNEALASASQALAQRGADRLVVLAADLPLVQSDDVATVTQADADVVVVPSGDGGTNALALPSGGIAFRFGPESARRHLAAAREAGLRSLRLDLPALALDIDTPDDLARLRAAVEAGRAVGRNTLATLVRLGLVAESVRER